MKTEPRHCLALSILWFALTFFASLTPHLSAQTVPALVNYQGRLANADGSPLPTADYTLTFNLYDAATNGARVWGPQVFDGAVAQGHGVRVPVVQGWFNVMLGPVDTNGVSLADAFNGTSRYVEVTVSNRPPIAPRQQILTTPFAFQAANSAKLAGYDWSAVFGTNNPVTGAIPFSKLAQRGTGTNDGIGRIAISGSSGAWSSPNPAGSTAITNFNLTITTRGNPVMVCFVHDGSPGVSYFNGSRTGGNSYVALELFRNGSRVAQQQLATSGPGSSDLNVPPGAFLFMDFPSPGIQTYEVHTDGSASGATTLGAFGVRMVVLEL